MELGKIQQKLQKLLALSASPNEAEASLAMEKCRAIMEKYDIRTIDVDVDSKEANVKTGKVDGQTKAHCPWEAKLSGVIADAFEARSIAQHNPTGGWHVLFIASASERDIIIDLFKRLRWIINEMANNYCYVHSCTTRSVKHAYALGMIETIHRRLHSIYRSTPDTPSTTDLVLIKKDAIARVFDAEFPDGLDKSTTEPPQDGLAYAQGEIDGEGVPLHKSVKHENQATIQ